MASGNDSYQTFGSFGVVKGIPIRISDKFRPPAKLTLPNDWKDIDPSELLSYQYDFSKERNALVQADEERLNQSRQKQQREEEARLKEEEERLQKENEEERLRKEELEKAKDLKDEEDHDKENDTNNVTLNSIVTATVTSPTVITSTMLTPLVVTNNSAQKQQQLKHTFDPLEFENQNDNPFEVVERATLNEFDELRSVLEPETKVIKPTPDINNGKPDDFELSSIFFNPAPTVQDENIANIIPVTDSEEIDHDYTNEGFDTIPHQPSEGSLTWTQFSGNDARHIINPFNPLNPFQSNFQSAEMNENNFGHQQASTLHSKTPPPSVGHRNVMINSSDDMLNEDHSRSDYENSTQLPRTKSLPNLQDQNNDYENKDNISFLKSENGISYGVMFSNSQESQEQQAIPTGRIENIMKQFQFQRITPVTSSQAPMNNSVVNNNLDDVVSSMDNNTVSSLNYPSPPVNTNPFGVSMASYVPPYMVSTSNSQNTMTYQQQQQQQRQPLEQNHQLSYPSYQNEYISGGPMLIQSRPEINTSSQSTSNITSDPVINLHQISNEVPVNRPAKNILPPINTINNTNRVYAMPTFGTSPSNNSVNHPVPLPRNLADNVAVTPPAPFPRKTGDRKMIPPSEPTVPPRRPQSSKLPDVDLKNSPIPPLPNITVSTSFLQDPYNSLSTSEKNFANQLHAMGFPLPCISRTIKRLGMDEKEVLDFLVLVEEMKESTKHDGDDIEIALQNSNNNKIKSQSYLEMVSTFKELGFQRKNIHEALQETSCDQNKALDYLTR